MIIHHRILEAGTHFKDKPKCPSAPLSIPTAASKKGLPVITGDGTETLGNHNMCRGPNMFVFFV